MKSETHAISHDAENGAARSRISDHARLAGCILFVCCVPTIFYFMAFSEFKGSQLPWKMALIVQLLVPAILLVHYFSNRNTCRMWYEGCAATISMFALWMVLGSCPFIYFGFAPMPVWEHTVGLLVCIGGTIFWLVIVWSDYVQHDQQHRLKETLFVEETSRFVYRGAAADLIVSCLPQRNPFTRAHFWLVSIFGPLLGGVCLIAFKVIPQSSGPHAMFLFLSFLSFPLSQWVLGYLGVRTVYFHVYLPLKIERETGKKVILGP